MEIVLQTYHTPSIMIQFLTVSSTLNSVGLHPCRTYVITLNVDSLPFPQLCPTPPEREMSNKQSSPSPPNFFALKLTKKLMEWGGDVPLARVKDDEEKQQRETLFYVSITSDSLEIFQNRPH